MAFQFDLYLTERFAVSEFHLVLFLFRQPTKTSQICCCLHLKGLNSLLAPNLATTLPSSTLFQILKAAKNKVCALIWIKNKFNIFLNFAGNSSMVVNFKQSWFSCLLTFLEQNYGCKDAAQAQQ